MRQIEVTHYHFVRVSYKFTPVLEGFPSSSFVGEKCNKLPHRDQILPAEMLLLFKMHKMSVDPGF